MSLDGAVTVVRFSPTPAVQRGDHLVGLQALVGSASGAVGLVELSNDLSDPDAPIVLGPETELRTERGLLSRVVTFGSTIGLATPRAAAPSEAIVGLRYLREGGVSCALALSAGGKLKLWRQIAAPAVDPSASPAQPAFVFAHSPAAAAEPNTLPTDAAFATWHEKGMLAIALYSGNTLYLAVNRAVDAADVQNCVARLTPIMPPDDAPSAPLLKLSLGAVDSTLELLALYASSPPALFCGRVAIDPQSLAVGAPSWVHVELAADLDTDLKAGDVPTLDPLASLTEFYIGRLLLPMRFAPKLLGVSAHAALGREVGRSGSVAQELRRVVP